MLSLRIEAQLNYFMLKAEIAVGNEILVLCGPSGCGKTTVLNLIAGLVNPDDGFIRLNERTLFSTVDRINIRTRLRGIGYIFQDYALFPHMTVEQNICYGLATDRRPTVSKPTVNTANISQVLEIMKIEHLKKRFPSQLSGGERQRVAVARALITEPELLLLDEPLSALDMETRREIQSELREIQQVWGIPFILVTHDFHEAQMLGDKCAHLEISEGEHAFTCLRPSTLQMAE